MQDDTFPAAERILGDIDSVFKKDPKLKEFDIVHVTENHNKSPVLHVEHCLGLESWCVRHVYCYTYHRLMDIRQNRSRREDPDMLIRLLTGALLLNPDVTTFWNMRRELMLAGRLDVRGELHFTAVLLSRKPKCAEAFSHRKWVIGRLLFAGAEVNELLDEELQVCQYAADRYPNNYYAWSHRMWCMSHLASSSSSPEYLVKEWTTSEMWIESHVSDHTGMQYRQFVLSRLLELKHPSVEDLVEKAKKSLHQLLSSCTTMQLPSNRTEENVDIIQYCNVKSIPLITSELLLNMDLILRFAGHEALWYHRRYLLTLFKKILNCRGYDVNGTRIRRLSRVPVNKFGDMNYDKVSLSVSMDCFVEDNEENKTGIESISSQNGNSSIHGNSIPSENDQMMCFEEIDGIDKDERKIYSYLHKAVMWQEVKLINSCRPDEFHQQRLARQHQKWLLHILKVDMPATVSL